MYESNSDTTPDAANTACCLVLRRGPHEWRFRFEPADAPALLARVRQLANDPDAALDETDVRTLQAQIQRMHTSAAKSSPDPFVPDTTP